MTALVAVSSHLPETVAVADLQEPLGLDDQQVRRFTRLYGLDRICKSDLSEAQLLIAAAEKLDGLRGQEERVRYLIRAKGMRTTAPYPSTPCTRSARRSTSGTPRHSPSPTTAAPPGCSPWTSPARCWPPTATPTRWP